VVATASLEWDRHRQRSIWSSSGVHSIDRHAACKRVGRAGHRLGAIPKGRVIPLSRDELIECSAISAPRAKAGRSSDYPGQAARHPGPADRGGRGGELGRMRALRAHALGRTRYRDLSQGGVRRRCADAGRRIHDPPRAAQAAHPLRRHQQELHGPPWGADRRDHLGRRHPGSRRTIA